METDIKETETCLGLFTKKKEKEKKLAWVSLHIWYTFLNKVLIVTGFLSLSILTGPVFKHA